MGKDKTLGNTKAECTTGWGFTNSHAQARTLTRFQPHIHNVQYTYILRTLRHNSALMYHWLGFQIGADVLSEQLSVIYIPDYSTDVGSVHLSVTHIRCDNLTIDDARWVTSGCEA